MNRKEGGSGKGGFHRCILWNTWLDIGYTVIKQKCVSLSYVLRGEAGEGEQEGGGQWGGGISQMNMMECLGGHRL